MDTHGLLKHQGIDSYSAKYTPMHFQLLIGWNWLPVVDIFQDDIQITVCYGMGINILLEGW